MTNTIYRTGRFNNNPSLYSGEIYTGDYDYSHSMVDIASRIASDWKFDEQCRKNELARANRKE